MNEVMELRAIGPMPLRDFSWPDSKRRSNFQYLTNIFSSMEAIGIAFRMR